MGKGGLSQLFAIDLRSLVLVRVGLALAVITTLLERSPYLVAQYTDEGGFTRAELLMASPEASWLLSPHMLSGDAWWITSLFLLTALAALALLVGVRAQAACALCWLLVGSMHARSPWVGDPGDALLVSSLFFAAWLPLGSRWAWSVDERRFTTFTPPGDTLSVAGAILRHQAPLWCVMAVAAYGPQGDKGMPLELGVILLGCYALASVATGPVRSYLTMLWAVTLLAFGVDVSDGLWTSVALITLVSWVPAWLWDARILEAPESEVTMERPDTPPRWRGVCVSLAALAMLATGSGLVPQGSAWAAPATVLHISAPWDPLVDAASEPSGWVVVAATTATGETLDLQRGGAPLRWATPREGQYAYQGDGERRLLERAVELGATDVIARHARVLCDAWSRSQLVLLTEVRVLWATPSLVGDASHQELWRGPCD